MLYLDAKSRVMLKPSSWHKFVPARAFLYLIAVEIMFLFLSSGCLSGKSGLADLISVEATAPESIAIGMPVPLRVQITNTSEDPVELWEGIPPWDFIITNTEGREVWKWSNGKFWQLIDPHPYTLEAGSLSRECHWGWDQKDNNGINVGPGTYFFIGAFSATLSNDSKEQETVKSKPRQLIISENSEKAMPTDSACDTRRVYGTMPTSIP